jgi:hypothetical protein
MSVRGFCEANQKSSVPSRSRKILRGAVIDVTVCLGSGSRNPLSIPESRRAFSASEAMFESNNLLEVRGIIALKFVIVIVGIATPYQYQSYGVTIPLVTRSIFKAFFSDGYRLPAANWLI